MQKIAIFGGTFNPIHNGHLHLARQFSALVGFDRVLFIPTNVPPHKRPVDLAPAEDRLAMCRLAAEPAGFEACDLELRRAGPSYTSDTLLALHGLCPGGELYLIMGEDMFLTVENWHDAQKLFRLASICAAPRSAQGMAALREHAQHLETYGAHVVLGEIEYLPVSSTMVRRAAAAGQPLDALVPEQVARYIRENHLYGRLPL